MARTTFTTLAGARAILLAVVLALSVVPAPASSVMVRGASISVSPANGQFVAGQELTFTGRIGGPGKRAVRLQSHMGRAGDLWRDVPDATGRTNAAGSFTLRAQAPSMYGISYRVVSDNGATPSWTSQVSHQDVTLRTEVAHPDLDHNQALVGVPLALTASTSLMPVIQGRGLTLQRRVSPSLWATVSTTVVGEEGTGSFTVVPTAPGITVYRVRMEDWNQGIGHVGWFPSYPLYVDALAAVPTEPAATNHLSVRSKDSVVGRLAAPAQTTAAATHRWGAQRYDFDWEYGESLTDAAAIGTRRRGSWQDASDGTGRIALRNGAMQMSSDSEDAGRDGSLGSVWATLQSNAQPYGRWETRVMPMTFGGGSTDYGIKAELVPADPAAEHCGGQNITIFEMAPSANQVLLAARSLPGAEWTRTVTGVATNNAFHAFAIEVTKKKITWFIDGKAVGRVTDPSAVSGQPMTVRLTMQATGEEPMRTTRTLVDWVRAYPEGTGTKTRGGAGLTKGTHATTC